MKKIIPILILIFSIISPALQSQIKEYNSAELDKKDQRDDDGVRTIYSVKETGKLLQGECKVYALNQLSYSIVKYKDGKKEGPQKLYNKKGEMYLESTFVDGYEHGPGFFLLSKRKNKRKT